MWTSDLCPPQTHNYVVIAQAKNLKVILGSSQSSKMLENLVPFALERHLES